MWFNVRNTESMFVTLAITNRLSSSISLYFLCIKYHTFKVKNEWNKLVLSTIIRSLPMNLKRRLCGIYYRFGCIHLSRWTQAYLFHCVRSCCKYERAFTSLFLSAKLNGAWRWYNLLFVAIKEWKYIIFITYFHFYFLIEIKT